MNWQYLKYFEVVAQEEHFSRASEKLFITQSALSKSIAKLEEEIGVPLFERQGRNVQLTQYGKILRDHITTALADIDHGIKSIQLLTNSYTGNVRISSLFTMGTNYIPALFNAFIKNYPEIDITYFQKSTIDILMDILDNHIDLGFCGEFENIGEFADIEREPVLVEELFLYVPENHRLASRESINISEVMKEVFIGWNTTTGIYLSIENALKRAGIKEKFRYSFCASEDNTVAEMVRQGLGIAFIANCPSINTSNLVKIKVSSPFLSRTLYMVWKKNAYHPPSVTTFKYFTLSKQWMNANQTNK